MHRFWNKLRSPAGIACAIAVTLLLVGAALVIAEAPLGTIAAAGIPLALGAAFTGSPAGSTEYALQVGHRKAGVPFDLKIMPFNYTHAAGAGTGEINLCVLPPGEITIYPDLSRRVTTQMAAGSTMDIGFRAYTEPDGDVVAEDDNALTNAAAVNGGALDVAMELPADGKLELHVAHSNGTYQGLGLVIFASIDAGNIEDGDTIDGWVAYTVVG